MLKHYLKLNARLLSFNLDAQFSDVVDGLILVDLLATSRTHLRRHLGNEGSAAFLAWHGVTGEEGVAHRAEELGRPGQCP